MDSVTRLYKIFEVARVRLTKPEAGDETFIREELDARVGIAWVEGNDGSNIVNRAMATRMTAAEVLM
jgi:hypothetical protein